MTDRRVLALVGVLACMGCGDKSAESSIVQAQAKPAKPPFKPDANATPAAQLTAAYLDVQDRLASDDLAGARASFAWVQKPVAAVSDAALQKQVAQSASSGAAAKDLDAARKAFNTLSQALLAWLKIAPNPEQSTLRVASCPMAFGTGAKWLQRETDIRNPYYGSQMLSCGSIDASLKPGEKLAP